MKLLESNRNTGQQLTYTLIYKLSMLSIHHTIWINIVPTFKNCIESCTKTGRVCIYDLLVRNVLRLGSFKPPRLAAQPSRPPLRQLTFAELPVAFASSSKPQKIAMYSVNLPLCSDFFRTNKHPSRNDSTTYASLTTAICCPNRWTKPGEGLNSTQQQLPDSESGIPKTLEAEIWFVSCFHY